MRHDLNTAHAVLRQRQGPGARFDDASAPHGDLLLARRGTAFFARKLSELSDVELYEPSAIKDRSRAWVVVNVSFAARRSAFMIEALVGERSKRLPPDLERRFFDLDLAETLPPQAIRHLFRHSEVHLNVCWRDLKEEQWDIQLPDSQDPFATLKTLPRRRAVQVWQAALDLAIGVYAPDLPTTLKEVFRKELA